jgi:hypothetical protein
MIRWRSGSLLPTIIPTTTPLRRFGGDIEALYVRVLELAREMGLLKLGTVAADVVDGMSPTSVEALAWRLRTPQGKELYGLRKADPGTGVRHHQIGDGIPPVSAGGLDRVHGEWSLATMSWNIKRMYALSLG